MFTLIILDVFHHYTIVTVPSESPVLQRKISNLISYTPKGPPKRIRRKGFHRSYKISLYSAGPGKFPTGCLHLLTELLQSLSIPFSLNDHRGVPQLFSPKLSNISIDYRSYQLEGIQSGLRSGRAVFSWPPGTGKTELLIGLVASIGLPTLWLTSSKNVLSQTIERISTRLNARNCPKVKVVLPETMWKYIKGKIPSNPFEVGPERNPLGKYPVLIIDECHHTGAKSWYEIAMNCNAAFRFAVSATPFARKETNLHIQAAVGGDTHTMTYQEAYAGKWLSRPTVRMLYPKGKAGKKILPGIEVDWCDLYRVGIVDNSTRNLLALDEAAYYLGCGIHPLLMVKMVQDHAIPLHDLACKRFGSDNVGLITGTHSVLERETALQMLVDKKLPILISTCILGEGQDIPKLSALINMAGGNSKIQSTQIAGRVMRPASSANVSDFIDIQHGVLFKHSCARRKSYEKMGARILDIV